MRKWLLDSYRHQNLKFEPIINNGIGKLVVGHTSNTSTQEVEAGTSLWALGQPGLKELVPGQLGLLHKETLSQQNKTNKKDSDILFIVYHNIQAVFILEIMLYTS